MVGCIVANECKIICFIFCYNPSISKYSIHKSYITKFESTVSLVAVMPYGLSILKPKMNPIWKESLSWTTYPFFNSIQLMKQLNFNMEDRLLLHVLQTPYCTLQIKPAPFPLLLWSSSIKAFIPIPRLNWMIWHYYGRWLLNFKSFQGW